MSISSQFILLFLIKHFFKCVALLCIYIIIIVLLLIYMWDFNFFCMYLYPRSSIRGRGVYCFTSVCLSVQDIFRHIFLSNYWWQRSDIWSHASYRYPISWEAFFDPSDSYFLIAEERGYHKWALAHSSSCFIWVTSGSFVPHIDSQNIFSKL